ncbi:MAG: HEAT repeat domain-containing protein [Gemmataceae bacterium]
MRGALLAGVLVAVVVGSLPSAAPPQGSDEDEGLLRAVGIPTEAVALRDHLRKRFSSTWSDARLKQLVEQLGDDAFERREEASRELLRAGQAARALLLNARDHTDLEVRTRAERLLKQIYDDGKSNQAYLAAALRHLGRRNPPGSCALLFEHLPSFKDDPLAPIFRDAILACSVREGRLDPVVLAQLRDRDASRRLVAAAAILQARQPEYLPLVRALLRDEDPEVKQELGLILATRGEREAIPALIQALEQPITPRYGQIEELLIRLAGEKAPVLEDDDEKSRQAYRQAWDKWWKDQGPRVDLAELARPARLLGRTMVVLLDEQEILDLDADNRIRWKIAGIEMPLDVQPLPGNRVLLAEYRGNRVTERTSKGKVIWEKRVEEPLAAQRLPNGHTMIATKTQILEVDRAGKEIFSYFPPGGAEIMRAKKLPNGDVIMVTQLGATRFLRIDSQGREVRSFPVEVGTSGGRLDLTSRGNVLIPEMYSNRVAEYDATGKVIREIRIPQPIACVALPNGNVIITSMTEKRAVEIDPADRPAWEYRRDTRVTRAVRY